MALTRPRLSQLNTNASVFTDSISVLNQGATTASSDVGFLFNRANGLVSNVALYWSESTQSIITAHTSNTGVDNANIAVSGYANLTVGNVLLVNGSIIGVLEDLEVGNLLHGTVSVLTNTRAVTGIATSPVPIDWFSSSEYRSAKYVISTTDNTNTQYQTSEVILVQDNSVSTISSYGLVYSGGSPILTFTSNISSGNVVLWATGTSSNNSIKLIRSLIPV